MARPLANGSFLDEKYTKRAQEEGHKDWLVWIALEEARLGHEICGCWGKARKAPCAKRAGHGVTTDDMIAKQRAIKSGRCSQHGGMSLAGRDSPRLKTGVESGYGALLSAKNQAHWEVIQAMPNRRSQDGEMDLLRVRARQLVEMAEAQSQNNPAVSGQIPLGLMKIAEDTLAAAKRAHDHDNPDDLLGCLPDFLEAMTSEVLVQQCWDEITGILVTLNKVTATEDRKAADDASSLTMREVHSIFEAMADLTRLFVPEHKLGLYDEQVRQLRSGKIPDALAG